MCIALIYSGCHNKCHMDWVAEMTDMFFLTVLEAGGLDWEANRSGSGEAPSWLAVSTFPLCAHTTSLGIKGVGQRERKPDQAWNYLNI